MTKRILVVMAIVLLVAASAVAAQDLGSIAGTATDANKVVMNGVKVQLRNVDTGQLAGTTQSGADGAFSFTGLNPGNFVIEIVDEAGNVIGVSSSMAVTAGGVISGITVAASAAGALAGAAAPGGLAGFCTSTGGILVLAGVGAVASLGVAAVTGVIGTANNASPTK
jgi:hypothetical protein